MTANLDDAQMHLSLLLEQVERGEEIVISRAGRPIAKLVPYGQSDQVPRQPGLWEGQVWIADDFDELPEDLKQAFAGENE